MERRDKMKVSQALLIGVPLLIVGCGGSASENGSQPIKQSTPVESKDATKSNSAPMIQLSPSVKPMIAQLIAEEEPKTREGYIEAIVKFNMAKAVPKDKNLSSEELEKEIAEGNSMYTALFSILTIEQLKDRYSEKKAMYSALLSGKTASLSSGAVNLSHRNIRLGKGETRLTHFSLNGQSMNQSIDFTLPMVVQLKGDLDTTGKNSDAIGSIAYNLNGWVAGVVHGYANVVNQLKTHESAVMVSKSFNGFFIESQVGSISGVNKYDSGIAGTRYLVTLGYDGSVVSPFVQYQHLSFDAAERHGLYVGLDTDVLSIQTTDAKFTSKVLAKVGRETGVNTNVSAYLEWICGLKLSDGLEVSNTLNIGSNDQTVKLNLSFEQ
jgi:hypothetical protein